MSQTVLYLIAIVTITAIGVFGLVALEIGGVEVDRGLIGQILGIITPTLVALLALLRGVANGREIDAVAKQTTDLKNDVHYNTVRTEAMAEAVTKASASAEARSKLIPDRNIV